jgi:hypothetical protein
MIKKEKIDQHATGESVQSNPTRVNIESDPVKLD